jgi:hypothetical protein
VSANLCDAVAEVIEATSAEKVSASFSFAARRPLAVAVPRIAVFTADTAVVLREAAARLRAEATYPATELAGPVVKVNSSEPSHGGEAVLHASIEGRSRSVRVVLEATAYQTAIAAHRIGALVRCVGDLAREGRSWVLRNPRDFTTIVEPEEA